MPVTKYGDVSEMGQPERHARGGLGARIRRCWDRAATLSGFCGVRGVQKFRSLSDAQRARQEARLEHMKALRRRRATLNETLGE